ncbi:amidase [Acuticoccus mangrovi]|uniref:Indoleacetamide hydrolase n=1 Tax=Acuticoccus mangrovi TaxID=2796142 RepID=A0A934MJA6_9HYPH|nr:amidase [Acuticoccus mangrovi]
MISIGAGDAPFLSLTAARAALEAGALDPERLVEECLARIEAYEPAINAFIAVRAEGARRDARRAARERRSGDPVGALHGLPIAIKDLFTTRERATTFGSPHFIKGPAGADAAVVERLEAAGAIIIGYTNLDEFAFGSFNANPHFGQVHNPWALDRHAGGSSGGSAAAVAAGFALAAIGTDTGVSIRQPAAVTGLVGLKPTFGLVSRYGAMPLSETLDHVGPMTRTVGDAALLLSVLGGLDARDPASRAPAGWQAGFAPRSSLDGVRVGVPRHFFFDGCEAEVRAAFDAAIEVLGALGARVDPIELAGMEALNGAQSVIAQAEAAAFHAEAHAARPETFGPSVRDFIARGGRHGPAEIARAHADIERITAELAPVFASVDVIATPTTPHRASPIADGPEPGDALRWRYTGPFTALGWPAVSVPCGVSSDGLPVGIQLVGERFADMALLSVAAAYEAATLPLRSEARPPIAPA